MEIQHAILEKLTKLESYLYYDEETQTPGMVQKVRDLQDRLEKLELEHEVKKRFWVFWGMVGGVLVSIGIAILQYFLTSHR